MIWYENESGFQNVDSTKGTCSFYYITGRRNSKPKGVDETHLSIIQDYP